MLQKYRLPDANSDDRVQVVDDDDNDEEDGDTRRPAAVAVPIAARVREKLSLEEAIT